jgi:hypothetical protein
MAQIASLMQRAQSRQTESAPPAGDFKRPDIKALIPPEQADAVQRIVAAGMKIMYSPGMREELAAEVKRDAPVPQKMARGVVGLMMTMDKQSKGGLPAGALFPAMLELMGEAAETLTAAGQEVTQEDYNEAVRMGVVLIAQGLGAKDPQQLMDGLAKGMPPEQAGAPPEGSEMPGDEQAEAAEGVDDAEPPGQPMPDDEQELMP